MYPCVKGIITIILKNLPKETEAVPPKKIKQPKPDYVKPLAPVPTTNTVDPDKIYSEEDAKGLNEPTVHLRFCLGRIFDYERCLWAEKFTSHNMSSHWNKHHTGILDRDQYTLTGYMKKTDWELREFATKQQMLMKKRTKLLGWDKLRKERLIFTRQELIKRYGSNYSCNI